MVMMMNRRVDTATQETAPRRGRGRPPKVPNEAAFRKSMDTLGFVMHAKVRQHRPPATALMTTAVVASPALIEDGHQKVWHVLLRSADGADPFGVPFVLMTCSNHSTAHSFAEYMQKVLVWMDVNGYRFNIENA